ncbi:TPA: shikimate dehydrogenase [Candidatus Galligastranaerophilus intestinigallinarum]|nr:shikimate dehydrogenase [Candidatus Galligastranaerophilus intestinigallinarum]
MDEKVYKLGIIGCPLSHSLSKFMHEAALKDLGLNGSYDTLETKSEDLIQRIKFLKTNGYLGFNVTIPHKIPISLFLSDVDEFANKVGSVNTVVIDENKNLKGYNTDVFGFMEPIKDIDLNNKKAVVLGTGGASRAVVAGLYFKGVKKIDIYTRNVINSTEAVNVLRQKFNDIEIKLLQYEVMETLNDVSIVVNTTPLGMKNFRQGVSPLSDEMIKTLSDDAIIYDIVYNPIKTELIQRAIKYNKKYVSGLDMLVYQGAKAFEIWTGTYPNTDKMKIAALMELV